MRYSKIIIIAFSSLILVGCYDKQIITRTEVKTIEIPAQLLEVNQLERPLIENEADIIDAYIELYKNYLLLIIGNGKKIIISNLKNYIKN